MAQLYCELIPFGLPDDDVSDYPSSYFLEDLTDHLTEKFNRIDEKDKPSTVVHLLLSIFTLGFWLVFWVLSWWYYAKRNAKRVDAANYFYKQIDDCGSIEEPVKQGLDSKNKRHRVKIIVDYLGLNPNKDISLNLIFQEIANLRERLNEAEGYLEPTEEEAKKMEELKKSLIKLI